MNIISKQKPPKAPGGAVKPKKRGTRPDTFFLPQLESECSPPIPVHLKGFSFSREGRSPEHNRNVEKLADSLLAGIRSELEKEKIEKRIEMQNTSGKTTNGIEAALSTLYVKDGIRKCLWMIRWLCDVILELRKPKNQGASE